MAIIKGQIESLKQLKKSLADAGISRFNSIAGINNFQKDYEREKLDVPFLVSQKLNQEIKELSDSRVNYLVKSRRGIVSRIIYWFKLRSVTKRLNQYKNNYDSIYNTRITQANGDLEFTKEVLDDLYPLIAGSIGENAVVKELSKLNDDFYVINDFELTFDPPIYNKKEDDKIFSIQIDHLVISTAGLFLIETKNWSKNSVQNLSLRSPVKQIQRTGYALFVLLNSDSEYGSVRLSKHHWGEKKISIRNVIAMTNAKPLEEFRHVKIITLKEINKYIQYFEPTLTNKDVFCIFDYLTKRLEE